MSEVNQELAAIQHLLEIEKLAASLIDSAKIEAEQCISKAHAEYNAAYKEKVEILSSELESDFQKKHDEILKKYQDEVEAYKTSFAAKPLNKEALFSLLEKLLIA
jgi:vacuolar-type H+-ATPase subunit H